MRLIDAELLEEVLMGRLHKITESKGGYRFLDEDEKQEYDKFENFIAVVRDQPTAYDIDAVVEALISESSFVAEKGLKLIPVIEAIKTVKKGGIE